MRTPGELTTAFRERGLKVTPQRQLLFRLLHGNDRHPSAEMLFATASAEMPGISLRTVYQTLSDLSSMGELAQVSLGVGPVRFDPNTDEHQHALCTRCGALRDVYVAETGVLEVQGLDEFVTTGASIVFHGECVTCQPATSPTQARTSREGTTRSNDG